MTMKYKLATYFLDQCALTFLHDRALISFNKAPKKSLVSRLPKKEPRISSLTLNLCAVFFPFWF